MNNSQINKEQEYTKLLETLETFFNKYPNLSIWSKYTSIVSAIKNHITQLFFVGFYFVTENELQVGPYQSTIIATPRISYGKGQCGQCWAEKKILIQNDVKLCQNYIACDNETQSEIVLPVFCNGEVTAVLDIDSDQLNRFDEIDSINLQKALQYLQK